MLYLLHGLSDDHTAWLRYTSIERYADGARAGGGDAGGAPLASTPTRRTATPTGTSSPRSCPRSSRRSSRCRPGARTPSWPASRWAGTAPSSSACTTRSGTPRWPASPAPSTCAAWPTRLERVEIVQRVFDGTFGPDDDLYELLDAVDPTTMPPLYISCGTEEDRLMDANTRLAEQARARARRHHRLPSRRARVGAVGRRDPGRHRLAAAALGSLAWRHEARARRRRRPERLLRRRLAPRRGRRPGRQRHRRAAPPLERQGPDAPDYAHVVATKDHHVDPGDHWADEPDYVDSWPVHCQVGTDGEAFHPNLDPQPFDAIFLKGEHVAAYSGFEGREARRPAWPTGCAPTRSRPSTSAASPPTTASAPPPSTAPARASPPRSSSTSAPASPPRPPQAALAEMRGRRRHSAAERPSGAGRHRHRRPPKNCLTVRQTIAADCPTTVGE